MVNAGVDIPYMDPMRNKSMYDLFTFMSPPTFRLWEIVMELGTLAGIPK